MSVRQSAEHAPEGSETPEPAPGAATQRLGALPGASEADVNPGERPCPFCEIVAGRAPAEFVTAWDDAIAITPLNPVTPGHTLVIPRDHVRDFSTDPDVSAIAMYRAAELAQGPRPMNLITSKGREATQSVWHLHVHLVPRAANDGLALPWFSGRSRTTRKARPEPIPAPVAETEISVRGWTA